MKYYPHIIEMDKTQKCSTLPNKLPLNFISDFKEEKKTLLQTVSYLCKSVTCLQTCTGLLLGWVTGFTGAPWERERDIVSGTARSGHSSGNNFPWQLCICCLTDTLLIECTLLNIPLIAKDVFSLTFQHNVLK